jgi:hypothetical protein
MLDKDCSLPCDGLRVPIMPAATIRLSGAIPIGAIR